MLPLSGERPLYWWRVEQGAIAKRGSVEALHDEEFRAISADAGESTLALLPSSETAIYCSSWPDLTLAQAAAAANAETLAKAMGARDDTHVASAPNLGEGGVTETISASTSAAYLSHWLDELALADIDPDAVTPAGLILPASDQSAHRAVIGDDIVIRSADMVFSDEETLRSVLLGDSEITDLTAEQLETQLLAAFARPPLNLRQGIFAKKRQLKWLTRQQIKRLSQMAAAIMLLVLAGFLVEIVKYHISEDQVRSEALAEAQEIFPNAADISGAEQMADAELQSRGMGQRMFTVPAVALFNAIDPIPSISARNLSYQADGVVTVTLAAPRKEDIDTVLLQLQREGYQVSVPPALTNDATGSVVADGIRVWVP